MSKPEVQPNIILISDQTSKCGCYRLKLLRNDSEASVGPFQFLEVFSQFDEPGWTVCGLVTGPILSIFYAKKG